MSEKGKHEFVCTHFMCAYVCVNVVCVCVNVLFVCARVSLSVACMHEDARYYLILDKCRPIFQFKNSLQSASC